MSAFTTSNYTVASVAPGSPAKGDYWYNTTTSTLLQFTGTVWQGVMGEPVTDLQTGQSAASWATSHTIFVAPNTGETWQVAAVSEVHGTASTSGTLQVEVATGTQAVASGTNQLSGTMSLSGTANTTVNGTLIAAPTVIAAGSRINLIFAGTVTNLANAAVTVMIIKLT